MQTTGPATHLMGIMICCPDAVPVCMRRRRISTPMASRVSAFTVPGIISKPGLKCTNVVFNWSQTFLVLPENSYNRA